MNRRGFLTGALAAPLLAAGEADGADFRGNPWMPTARVQTTDNCSVAALTGGVSYLMGRAYGWTHDQKYDLTDIWAASGARAAFAAGQEPLNTLMPWANRTGIVSPLHPHTRIRVGYTSLAATDTTAIKMVLRGRLPVLATFRMPATWGSSNIRPALEPGVSGWFHTVFVCGYGSAGMLFLNSMGSGWSGSGGYGLLPWSYWADNALWDPRVLTSVTPAYQ